MKVKFAQSCPPLCHPMDFTVHGILQVRILGWVVIPFSRGSSQPRDGAQVSRTAERSSSDFNGQMRWAYCSHFTEKKPEPRKVVSHQGRMRGLCLHVGGGETE